MSTYRPYPSDVSDGAIHLRQAAARVAAPGVARGLAARSRRVHSGALIDERWRSRRFLDDDAKPVNDFIVST